MDYLRAVDKALSTGGLYLRMAEQVGAPVWFREWIEEERRAVQLRWYEPGYMPGLLQTEAYARITLADEALSEEELDQAVTSRLARQAVLDTPHPPLLVAVLDAAVLTVAEEQRDMMVEQLHHLVAMAQRPQVQVQIVPAQVGVHSGRAGALIIADAPDGTRVVHADSQLSAHVSTRPADVATLERRWSRILGRALPRAESFAVITKAVEAWS